MSNYYNSNNIKVFPSNRRSDIFDRQARLTTEQNLINIVNRLTGNKSFVIEGLEVQDNKINIGKCNINGYYFELNSQININNLTDLNNAEEIGFQIILETSNKFNELKGNDDINNLYSGLAIVAKPAEINSNYLPIAVKSGNNWISASNNKLIIDIDKINVGNLNKSGIFSNVSNNQDLNTTLNSSLPYLIIDDGEL